jgi:Flp pilus assembly protein TadG
VALGAVGALGVVYAAGRQGLELLGTSAAGNEPPGGVVGEFTYGLTRAFLVSLLPYLGGMILLTCLYVLLALALRRTGGAAAARAAGGESGASVTEFILAFPILLALLLAILQIALLVQAKFIVNYAAFCAVRSAIVTIPARVRSGRRTEERNVINTRDADSPKMKIIRRAAALPCLAISPVWSSRLVVTTGTAYNPSAVAPLSRLTVFAPSLDYERQVLSRALYAYDRNNTTVEVAAGRGDHDPVTVTVTHRYYLAVPFANRVFGQSYFGGWLPRLGIRTAWYYPITEHYTLLNEGEPPYPESQRRRFGDSDVEIERY